MNATFTDEPSLIVATCSAGIAPFLANELTTLGFRVGRTSETTVETEGTLADCMRMNMHLRTAHRILYTLDRFRARTPGQLYQALAGIPWERYLDPFGYFSIDKSVDTPTITDTRFASLKAKDAIVDRMRETCGRRPNTGNERDQACLFLHWIGDAASIYIDTSGESLSFRGYRRQTSEAPMRESLAAAVIMASGWNRSDPFVNPMCGCGTLAIEAAWMAQNRAPALLRENFSFMHLAGYPPALWTQIRSEAIKTYEAGRTVACPIVATDIDAAMIAATRENAALADVENLITLDVCDFMLTPAPPAAGRGTVVFNPPYGGRIGDPIRLRNTYAGMGVFLKQHRETYDGFIFTGNPDLAVDAGLVGERIRTFYSGRIECALIENPAITPEAESAFNRRHAVR